MDKTGQFVVVAVRGGGIYSSGTYGESWVQTSAPNENWLGITIDNTGQHAIAVVDGGGIYSVFPEHSTYFPTPSPSALPTQSPVPETVRFVISKIQF
jgi:hypothetical protein